MPVRVTDDEFETLVSEALELIPPELAEHIENVALIVQDRPSANQQRAYKGMLLGLYEGVSLTRRSPTSYSGVMPDRITIFKEPHLRVVNSVADLRRRIAVTVVHEVGHHFVISDERLDELGW